MSLRADIGIDLGTASVLVYIKGRGIVMNEPSVVAIDRQTKKFLAVGEEAKSMLGRTPGNIVAIRPLKDGVISDYEITERMLKHFIKKAIGSSLMRPQILICIPSSATEVEKRAVVEASTAAGAIRTELIEEPVAAAIGAGIDITEASGNMVIDIGGGTTDIAVISLGGIVVSKSINVAGDVFNESISKFIRKKYNMMIGETSAERIKIAIGCAYPQDEILYARAMGRNLVSGLPLEEEVDSEDMLEALREPVLEISDAVHNVLERTPPELASDIANKGIYMTGGGSLLKGMDRLIEKKTGIHTVVAEDPIACVAIGTGKSLEWIKQIKNSRVKL